MYKILPTLLFAYGFAITTDDIYDNCYALNIGIDKYENVQNLNYAVKDAESIQDILVNTFNFPEGNVRLLINEDATLLRRELISQKKISRQDDGTKYWKIHEIKKVEAYRQRK